MSSNPEYSEKKVRPQGKYANYFEVGMSYEEVVIDFGQAFEGQDSITFHTRIVTSPAYARSLELLLHKAFRKQPGAEPAADRKASEDA
jgi:Protein of unknown function (DUF3467)